MSSSSPFTIRRLSHALILRRAYISLPSSFEEVQHDWKMWWNPKREKRTIAVKLMRTPRIITAGSTGTRTGPTPPGGESTTSVATTKHVTLKEYSRDGWFDADGYPLTSRDEAGRFVNPWKSETSNGSHSLGDIFKWRSQRIHKIPLENASTEPPVAIGRQELNISTDTLDPDMIRLSWIGHATCLINISGYTIITDPHFSSRAAPFQINGLPFNGVRRHVPPACHIRDLPHTVDICLLSHDHYDHLDRQSCIALNDRVSRWIVPLGIKEWLIKMCDIPEDKIDELQWWDSIDCAEDQHKSALRITCAPAQHWSCRTVFDRNKRLWCSFALESHNKKFYFGGDTGMPKSFPLFEMIGQKLGPFDLAAIAIGAYKPRFFMADSHVDPIEAVEIHKRIGSKKSVGIHWGSFRLADEKDHEPRKLLEATVQKESVNFTTLKIGGSVEV